MAPILPDQQELVLTESRTMRVKPIERHVYVIEFTSGTLKVGQTGSPKNRLKEHEKGAEAHGYAVARSWFSDAHVQYDENEAALIAFCGARWSRTSGREFFLSGDFDLVVDYAQGLPFRRETEEEKATRQAHSDAIGASLSQGLRHRQVMVELEGLEGEAVTVAALANDENLAVASAMGFEITKRALRLTATAWADTDPVAAERYLVSRGVQPDAARTRAADFELSFRALYALSFQQEANSFQDLIDFCESAEAAPQGLFDLGGAA